MHIWHETIVRKLPTLLLNLEAELDVHTMMPRRRQAMGSHMRLFYDPAPLHLVRGEGARLFDTTGKAYIDCYNNVATVGHCHPRVARAIANQAAILNTNTRYLTDQSVIYAERLLKTVDPSLDCVLYVNSGSEANDVAYRIAKALTGNTGVLATQNAYHGITYGLEGMTPASRRAAPAPKHVRNFTPPNVFSGPYKRGEPNLGEKYAALLDEPIRQLKAEGFGVAYGIMDCCFMSDGVLEAPEGYMQAVCDRVRAAGGLFIADEVQSGFGRTGSMWGHQTLGCPRPDMITIGKPACNGIPVGAIILR